MSEHIVISLLIKKDLDPELYRLLSQYPKGRIRSEFVRRLLSKVKLPSPSDSNSRQAETVPPASDQLPEKKANKIKAVVLDKPIEIQAKKEIPAPDLDSFESNFVLGLGGVPKK